MVNYVLLESWILKHLEGGIENPPLGLAGFGSEGGGVSIPKGADTARLYSLLPNTHALGSAPD